MPSLKRVAIIVSSPVTVKAFLTDHIAALSRIYQVSVVANIQGDRNPAQFGPGVSFIDAPIVRDISVTGDLRGLLFLINLFAREKFDAVHSITPKAGLLAALAGAITRTPVRIHTFTGQVWATRHGFARLVLKALDKVTANLTTHVLVDSPSQRDFLVREGVLSEGKSRVLANGSICGVDTARFRPDAEWKKEIRQRHGIPDHAVVFLFVGRLKADKGVLDLAQAFSRLKGNGDEAWLLIVGPDEEGLQPRMESLCHAVASRLRFAGHTDAPQEYMAAADVFCLPSYREGFGSVIIEAASAGIPAIASEIYGITDAIEPGFTGLLHPPGNADALQSRMQQLADDPQLREVLGGQARLRAHRRFAKEQVTAALIEFYTSVVGRQPVN